MSPFVARNSNKESVTTCQTSDREEDSLSTLRTHGRHEKFSAQKRKCCKPFSDTSKVSITRILFILCLLGVAVGLGFAINALQSQAELTLAKEQFDAIAERALNTSVAITQRKRMGTVTLASIISTMHPDSTDWPNIWINEFETVANNIIGTSDGRSMGLMPLVYEETLADFETFLYDDVIARKCPNDTAVHSFGRGVHGNDPSLNTTDNRYHETDGATYWKSPFKVITPYLYHSYGCAILSFNLHSFELFGRVIDDVLECFDAQQGENNDASSSSSCTTLSDALYLIGATPDHKSSPAAILIEAIYPSNNPTALVGIISSTIEWSDVLVDVFSPDVSGVDAVLSTETQSFTYEILNGVAIVKGESDMHNPEYNQYGRSAVLNSEGGYSNSSATYTLTLYPNDAFYGKYSTQNRYMVPIGAALLIVLATSVFFVYDRFVTQEVRQNKAVLEAKRQHVRFISHEVRTPLNAVAMGQQLLRDEMKSFSKILRMQKDIHPPETHQLIEDMEFSTKEWLALTYQVYSNTISATDVLNDLLNYDKIESGTLALEKELVSIESLVEKTTLEFDLQARQNEVDLSFKEERPLSDVTDIEALDEQQLLVVGDPIRLTQVIRNFVSNGIKFTPAKGRLNVVVRHEILRDANPKRHNYKLDDGHQVEVTDRGFIHLTIQDTGAGLSRDQLATIFGKGVQFNANKLQRGQGSGLGLYIAKGIIEQHGGSLTVDSEGLGKGTTFIISLPLVQVLNQDSPKHKGGSCPAFLPRQRSFTSLENLNVLVVDDAEMNRKLLCRLLENHGHVTDQAENGQVAVSKYTRALQESKPYHTILMDHEMPEMDGPEATRAIRKLEEKENGASAYIIGVTGDMFPEDVQYFKDSGAEKVLEKPLRYDELQKAWLDLKYSGEIVTAPTTPRSA